MKSDELIGPKLKIDRANRHIADTMAQVLTFYRTDPNVISHAVEPDAEPGRQVLKVRINKPLPVEIAGSIGDALHNLRSALDYIAYALAKKAGNPERRQTEFPFAGNEYWFKKEGTQRKIRLLPPEAQAIITNELKPYRGGNDFLWSLNDIRNRDTHEIVVPVGAAILGANGNVKVLPKNPGVHIIEAPKRVRLEQDQTAILLKFPEGEFDGNYNITTDVAFRDVEVVDGEPVVATLHQYSSMVTGILRLFEDRFFR